MVLLDKLELAGYWNPSRSPFLDVDVLREVGHRVFSSAAQAGYAVRLVKKPPEIGRATPAIIAPISMMVVILSRWFGGYQ